MRVVLCVLLLGFSVVQAGLVAEYLFEEGSGTAAGDTGGFGNNGYFSGPVTWDSGYNSGNSAFAADFSGEGYVTIDDSASLDTMTRFSMTAWINVAQSSTNSTIAYKLGAFRIWKQNSNLMVTLDGVPTVTNYTVISGQIPNDSWVHIGVTYNGQYIAGYVNGVRVHRVRVNDPIVYVSTSNYPLRIGWHSSTPYYRGSIDMVRFYNHELTLAEVTADMNRTGFFSSSPLSVVQNGAAQTAIVVPDGMIEEVVTLAAEELRYHIQKSTGISLGIFAESTKPTTYGGLIYVGRCNATKLAGIEGRLLEANGYVARSFGPDLYLAGQDNYGAALGMLHINRTRIGTMLSVYRFLEKYMGVRWLWPGESGEVIPQHDELTIAGVNFVGKPTLLNTNLIDHSTEWGWGGLSHGWASSSNRDTFLNNQSRWMRRHGFCNATGLTDYGHSLDDWWDRYGVSHPEYFALLPDGTRRPDPLYWGGVGYLASFCLSQPGVWETIVDEWVAAGANGMINCALTDAPTVCTCANCLAWDEPDPDLTIPWAERLSYAANAWYAQDSAWHKYLGRTSDRYAKFMLAVQQEAQLRGYVNAEVFGFAYTNRYQAPLQTHVNDRVTLGIVPWYYFPLTWTDQNQQIFRDSWESWGGSGGANLFFRPNDFLSGHNMPIFTAKRFGTNFIYALRRGMMTTNFDSLIGQWASQAANFYMLARVQTHVDTSAAAWGPDLNGDGTINLSDLAMFMPYWLNHPVVCSAGDVCADDNRDGIVDIADFAAMAELWHGGCSDVEVILDEFYEAFGPAAAAIRAYFEHWENVSDNTTVYNGYHEYYKAAPQVFTSSVMAVGRNLMTQAQQAAGGDPTAERLVGFLEKGLTHAELTLAAQIAWQALQDNPAPGASDYLNWTTALANLDTYRASVEDEGICNMGFLYWAETYNWR